MYSSEIEPVHFETQGSDEGKIAWHAHFFPSLIFLSPFLPALASRMPAWRYWGGRWRNHGEKLVWAGPPLTSSVAWKVQSNSRLQQGSLLDKLVGSGQYYVCIAFYYHHHELHGWEAWGWQNDLSKAMSKRFEKCFWNLLTRPGMYISCAKKYHSARPGIDIA